MGFIKELENFAKGSNPISVVIRTVTSFKKLNTKRFIVLKQVTEKMIKNQIVQNFSFQFIFFLSAFHNFLQLISEFCNYNVIKAIPLF